MTAADVDTLRAEFVANRREHMLSPIVPSR